MNTMNQSSNRGRWQRLAAKARALMRGRYHVTYEDVRALYIPVLRHRVLLNYRAEAEGLNIDTLIGRLIDAVGRG